MNTQLNNKEIRVYGVDIEVYYSEMSKEEIIEIAELDGMVYSLEGFLKALNEEKLNTEDYFYFNY